MQKKILAATILALFVMQACVTPMGMAASNVPVSPEQIEKTIGPAEGTSSSWSFSPLCLFSFGHPDFDEAIRGAIDKSQGDVLVDIRWYNKNACLLFATWDKLYLSGTAVKLKPKGEIEGKRRK
jgi:hypothetical protein